MYKLLFLLFIIFVITGCSLPGTQTENSNNETAVFLYEGSGFSLSLPKTWTPVKSTETPTPHHGTLSLAYISPEVSYGFSSNVLVMWDILNTPTTSLKYSELNHLQTTKNYLEYTKLQDSIIAFPDADESRVYVFEARYNPTTSRMKFIQTAKVCGSEVYLLHFTLSLDKDTERYINLLKTFQCQ